jgi:hypothetical protein
MKWLVRFLVGFAVLAAVAWIVGMSLPVNHTASRTARFAASPEAVRRAIIEVEKYPEWRPSVTRVVLLDSVGHGPAWREVSGSDAVTYAADTTDARRVVSRITDKSLPFGGSWEYAIDSDGNGTRLTITENGEVYSPLFRFMSRFVMGHTSTIDTYLRNLADRLGEEVVIEDGGNGI